jgi:hypothetical protein
MKIPESGRTYDSKTKTMKINQAFYSTGSGPKVDNKCVMIYRLNNQTTIDAKNLGDVSF